MTLPSTNPAELFDQIIRRSAPEQAQLLEATGDAPAALLSLVDEAAQRAMGETSRALHATDCVVQLADRMNHTVARARARRARARVLAYRNRFDEALTSCEEAVDIAQDHGQFIEAGRAQLASMHALTELGRLPEAVAAGQAARAMFLSNDEPSLAARADINLGVVYQRQDRPDTAVTCFQRARPYLKDEPLVVAHLDNNRGEALLALNDFSRAETAFTSALDGFESASASLPAAIAEGNLADLAARHGKLQDALFHFERARRHLESHQSPGHLARLVSEQADAKAILGLPAEALTEYESALPELERCSLALEAARARSGMGYALVKLGRFAEAETALAAAAVGFDELGHATARAKVDLLRAQVASTNGRLSEAKAMVSRAMVQLQDRPADAAAARYMLARAAMKAGDMEIAAADLAAALSLARDMDIAPLLADIHHARGLLNQKQKKMRAAVEELYASLRQVERVRGTLQAERFRVAFLGKRAGVYEDLIQALLDLGGSKIASEVFAVAEQAKSRSLLDQVQRSVGSPDSVEEDLGDADPAERELQNALTRARSELNALYSRLTDDRLAHRDRTAVSEWQKAIRIREQQVDSLESRLSTTRGMAGLFAKPIDLKATQNMLDSETVLLEYFIAHDSIMVFVVSRNASQVYRRMATVSEVQQCLQRVHFQIDRALRPGATNDDHASRRLCDIQDELSDLYSLLLAPLRRHLDSSKKLIIIPHGVLHLVPFQALFDGDQHLIQSHEIRYSPSASVINQLQSRRNRVEPTEPAVIGVSDEVAPQIAEEARKIGKILGCSEHRVLIDDQATVNSVSQLVNGASLVHFACHGRFASDDPLCSGLRMTDRWLTLRDMYRLRLNADLVTLSGCETGLNLVDAGDELVGLQRGFIAAGAKALLVSQWRVDDLSTASFMCEFYRLWNQTTLEQSTAANILRTAQLQMIRQQPHPAFWAPFILVG